MKNRHSVRAYTDRPIEGEVLDKLREKIDFVNKESGLDIRLMLNEPSAFGGLFRHMMRFRKAVNYIAVIGKDDADLPEKAGYYGEDIVLFAQSLGLNTCWAMLCGKKACELTDGERFIIGISVGYGETSGTDHKNRPVSDVADLTDAPEWFIRGVEAAMLAPTGMNAQKFRFVRDGNKVTVTGGNSDLKKIDLGIAKFHFECGAGKENFEWSA